MSIEVVPLGVNNAFSRLGSNTNYLVRFGSRKLLVDCGPSAGRCLDRIGENLVDIDLVYISHLHLDHIGGLFELGIRRFFLQLPAPKIFLHESLIRPLWENVLRGMMEHYYDAEGRERTATAETFFQLIGITQKEIDNHEALDMRGLAVRLFPVQHTPLSPCHGVILDDRVLCTTDTVFLPQKLEKAANSYNIQSIFHDCSFVESEQIVHTTYSELLTLPSDLREILILTHYQDTLPLERSEISLCLGEAGKSYRY